MLKKDTTERRMPALKPQSVGETILQMIPISIVAQPLLSHPFSADKHVYCTYHQVRLIVIQLSVSVAAVLLCRAIVASGRESWRSLRMSLYSESMTQ